MVYNLKDQGNNTKKIIHISRKDEISFLQQDVSQKNCDWNVK